MTRSALSAICGALVVALSAPALSAPALADSPEKALCAVCAVHGETAEEKVRASVEHEGTTYHFCAERCRDTFLAEPAAYAPATLPRPAPDFVVETLDGRDVPSADLRGKVVLVDFWATWCKPCEKLMPRLQQLYDTHRDRGFTVAGISIDEGGDSERKVAKFLAKHDVSYPVYLDAKDAPAWAAFRVKAVPAMFLVDAEGRIVAEWKGAVEHDEVAAAVARLLGDG